MQRKFLLNLILLIAINLLIKPLAIFGIDAQVQNRVGYEDYGIYFSLFNFTYLFNILLDLGITNFNIKNVAQFPILSKRYIGKLISLRILLFLVYVVLILTVGFAIDFRGERITILGFLIINQFLLSSILFFRSYFSGMLKFALDAFFSVFDKLLLIFICGYYLYIDQSATFSIYHFIFSQTFAYLISIAVILLLLSKKVGFQSFKVRPNFSIAIFKQALPYALLTLAMTAYTRIDAVLLERIHPNGALETGIYAQAYRILDAFVMFTFLFNTLLFPIFSTLHAKKEDIRPLLMTASKLLFTLALAVVLGSIFFAENILSLFYSELDETSVRVFQLLIISFLPISAIQVFGTLHTASGNLRFLNVLSLIGFLVSVGLNVFLIPEFGAVGTAITCIVTHLVIALSQIVYTKMYFHLKTAWKMILSLVVYGVLLIGTLYFLTLSIWNFGSKVIVFSVVAVVSSVLFRLINVREMKEFLQQ